MCPALGSLLQFIQRLLVLAQFVGRQVSVGSRHLAGPLVLGRDPSPLPTAHVFGARTFTSCCASFQVVPQNSKTSQAKSHVALSNKYDRFLVPKKLRNVLALACNCGKSRRLLDLAAATWCSLLLTSKRARACRRRATSAFEWIRDDFTTTRFSVTSLARSGAIRRLKVCATRHRP